MNRGGKRKGAGRKPLPSSYKRIPKLVTLPGWVWEEVDIDCKDLSCSRGELIEQALYEKLGLSD